MANHLDLEEQEQLDQLKHFWKQYGNAITWVLICILSAFAAWNFYQQWQRSQATQASAMYEEVERIVKSGDSVKIDRVFSDIKDKFASTTYAQQAGLLVALYYYNTAKFDTAKSSLEWVSQNSTDLGYQAIAKLRLAGILAETKDFAAAFTHLNGEFPIGFSPLVSDRKGDIYVLQGKKEEAIKAYLSAFSGFDEHSDYKRLVQIKLNSLGIDPLAKTEASVVAATQLSKGSK